MKNFNFSVFITMYILSLGWFFSLTKDLLFFLLLALVFSPLIWLAFYFQGRRMDKFHESEIGPVQFFQSLRMGWGLKSAGFLLVLDLGLIASALTIWSGYVFADLKCRSYMSKRSRLYFAGLMEYQRFLIYFYLLTMFWALGVLSLHLIWKSYSLKFLTIITARALIPAIVLLPIAILRLPFMLPASAGVLAVVGYLVKINLNTKESVVFVGIPLAATILFMAVRYILIPENGAGAKAAINEATIAPATEIISNAGRKESSIEADHNEQLS